MRIPETFHSKVYRDEVSEELHMIEYAGNVAALITECLFKYANCILAMMHRCGDSSDEITVESPPPMNNN